MRNVAGRYANLVMPIGRDRYDQVGATKKNQQERLRRLGLLQSSSELPKLTTSAFKGHAPQREAAFGKRLRLCPRCRKGHGPTCHDPGVGATSFELHSHAVIKERDRSVYCRVPKSARQQVGEC